MFPGGRRSGSLLIPPLRSRWSGTWHLGSVQLTPASGMGTIDLARASCCLVVLLSWVCTRILASGFWCFLCCLDSSLVPERHPLSHWTHSCGPINGPKDPWTHGPTVCRAGVVAKLRATRSDQARPDQTRLDTTLFLPIDRIYSHIPTPLISNHGTCKPDSIPLFFERHGWSLTFSHSRVEARKPP